MGDRLTLKQIGDASTAFDNQPNRFPKLNANFKVKSGLINLLPKFYGRPGEDTIKDINNFEVICATTRRTVGDKNAVKAFALHFSLDDREDNTVASTHNFFNATAIPPYNKRYYTQGWNEKPPNRWSLPQQQQNQSRQPYTYSQPQNGQNTRYQPPHNRHQYPPTNNPPMSQDEALHAFQKENQEMRDVQKTTASEINQLAEMLQKLVNQQVQPPLQYQPQLPIPNPLLSQPLPNPKGGINSINDEPDSEEEAEDTDDEGEERLCELLVELTSSKIEEDESSKEILDYCEQFDNDYEEESVKEGKSENGEAEDQNEKGKIFFINIFFSEKIRGVDVPGCLCDPGACGNIMPHALYETLDLGPLKKTREVFTIADASIVSVARVTENVMVKIGMPTIPADFRIIKRHQEKRRGSPKEDHGDILNYTTPETAKKNARRLREDNGRIRGKDQAQRVMVKALLRELLKKKEEGSRKKKKKKEKGKGLEGKCQE
ncbi:hypothetical protein PIB30_039841 [Stylosanthes scabra]|uniref:Uncharacterized protein n=1 Tax=Stylosanthes scabra TaxID=79078 RepID=A0ABU6TEL5_9FABA|nr:hypothetical protein [Stylosanthes scabra]